MIRLVIADDHAIVRRGVRRVLEDDVGMEVVGEVKDGDKVAEAVLSTGCDVLILDLSLPNRSGIELLRELRQQAPNTHVIVFSMYPEDQLSLSLIHEGASAYLNKEREPEELVTAIRRVAAGRKYLTDTLSELSVASDDTSRRLPHHQLTAREYQVFTLIIQGSTVSGVANELGLSISTVSNYMGAIRTKLGVDSNGDIVRYASRLGLV